MPIQQAALSLIDGGWCYGYQIKAAFEREMGPQWGAVNVGHLYQVLERLHRDGYVTATVQRQASRPDRTLFELTEAGRQELATWRVAAATRETGYRDEFFLKLAAAARAGRRSVRSLLDAQRQARTAELSSLVRLEREHTDDALVRVLIMAAQVHCRADLELIEDIETRVSELVEHAKTARANLEPRSSRAAGPRTA